MYGPFFRERILQYAVVVVVDYYLVHFLGPKIKIPSISPLPLWSVPPALAAPRLQSRLTA